MRAAHPGLSARATFRGRLRGRAPAPIPADAAPAHLSASASQRLNFDDARHRLPAACSPRSRRLRRRRHVARTYRSGSARRLNMPSSAGAAEVSQWAEQFQIDSLLISEARKSNGIDHRSGSTSPAARAALPRRMRAAHPGLSARATLRGRLRGRAPARYSRMVR